MSIIYKEIILYIYNEHHMDHNAEERDQQFFINAANELIGRTGDLESITAHQYSRLDILMNELLSSINETPQSAPHSAVERVQQNTLNEKPVYKKLLSSKGKECLKKIKYDNTKIDYNACPILQSDFEENEEITQLPCGHCFDNVAIEKWLTREKSECPVCRYELDYVEKKQNKIITSQDTSHINDEEHEETSRSIINLFNSLGRAINLNNNVHYSRRRRTLSEDYDLQEAIMLSLNN
tara:strand:+ start:7635 stop:8348 length:714 start_codon:yes stop_codon:yes gene_type:complete